MLQMQVMISEAQAGVIDLHAHAYSLLVHPIHHRMPPSASCLVIERACSLHPRESNTSHGLRVSNIAHAQGTPHTHTRSSPARAAHILQKVRAGNTAGGMGFRWHRCCCSLLLCSRGTGEQCSAVLPSQILPVTVMGEPSLLLPRSLSFQIAGDLQA
jgi:hypothetical protein